jgi:hypothetical protein
VARDRGGYRRTGASLKRPVGTRTPRRTFVIFCEGEQTEPGYLRALRDLPEIKEVAAVDLRIESQSAGFAPSSLVQLAVGAQEKAAREEGEVDEFWCVFDVEWPQNHPKLTEAVALATRHGIKLAISNPCFELWPILHFREWRAFLDTATACKELRKCDGRADKRLAGEVYMPMRDVAARRAAALAKQHTGDGTTFPHDNPSSGMFNLINSLGHRANP